MYTKKLIFSLAMALCSGSLMAQSEYIAPEFNTESVSSNGTIDSTSENVEVLSAPTYSIGSPVQVWGKL